MSSVVEESLYEKHVKIRPRPVKGRFQTLRFWAVIVLLAIFHTLPFFQWNGRQAILFDLSQRRFFVFGLNIWPQDFILLTFILLGLALVLFFFTAILGRVWCGYACPQTVYTEVFMWIEQKIEGNRSEQLKLARMSWKKREKQVKRLGKYFAWFLVALITGIGFVGYFTPIRALIVNVFTFNAPLAAYFWIAFYGGFCWLQAGLVREQFCKYICPYARFQGAMFDQDTMIIAYDEKRGEPRRRLKRADREHPEKLGFCVDCTMCVQVCPTGIDIRDGLQLECIACAACIDACDNMMDQINAPRGLIRYTSSNALEGKKTKFLRPKTLGYGLVLAVAFTLFIVSIVMKSTVEMDVIADRNMLSRELTGGLIQNAYTIKVLNKSEHSRTFVLGIEGLDDAKIEDNQPFTVAPSEVYDNVISIDVPSANLNGKIMTKFKLTVTPEDAPNEGTSQKVVFTGLLP
ncbi:cytochrome c oxidase accessory protein CcoG [Suttonella ornithocola]|uniref:Quinol dehydrogenase membrane component n=1 Tax=Suttonella ornithocola TaxID=279832 RepID=A0A380MZ23_9GAMM|nr:cytochrome c oxidase accessory protein CcoG [Suttonella ornithocola]SUO97562.1 quinol dehydrogenase membrane component [Suttonella ornithocola]